MRSSRLLVAAAVLAATACVITETAYERDGKRYGVIDGAFRGRWYNFYERGQSFADGGYCDEAIADFDAAIALRPDDQRRARTYGLHFLDYFPHRERGICLLQKGDVAGARSALEASLAAIDSGRAEFYLNEVFRQELIASGVEDTTAPAIELAAGSGLVRDAAYRLRGAIKDPSRVLEVSINGKPLLLPTAVDSYSLDAELDLVPGNNEIRIVAWDLLRNSSEQTVTLTLDEQPPAIALQGVEEVRGRTWLVGTVQDASGVPSLLVAGAKANLKVPAGEPTELRVAVAGGEIELRAEDGAGNVTTIQVDPAALRAQAGGRDASPPTIETAELPAVVYTDRIFVDGHVFDPSNVDVLEIAGQPVPGVGRATVYFRRVVHLKPGDNVIPIRALDAGGRMSESELRVSRRVPAARALENRLSVAMAPFVPVGDQAEGTEAVEQNLENAIVDQSRFFLLDRSRIAALVTEWQLVASDLAEDGPDLLRLGEELSSDTTLMGWVRESDASIEVYGRLVDTRSGAILLEKDVFHEKKSLRNVRDLLYGLALKLKAALPQLEGRLLAADADTLRIGIEDAGLLPVGAHLLVVDAEAGASPYGTPQAVLGQARIESINDDGVLARLIDGTAAANAAVVTK